MSCGSAFGDGVCLSVQGLYSQHTTTTPGLSCHPLSRQRSHRAFSRLQHYPRRRGRAVPLVATPARARWPRPGPVGAARPS